MDSASEGDSQVEKFEGIMVYGDYDGESNEFTLKRIKNIFTETSLTERQMSDLYNYLKRHEEDDDGQIISFYDQLLLKLNPNEIKVLLTDLEDVLSKYQ